MMIGDWSIVETPNGISIRYKSHDPEICVHMENDKVFMHVYALCYETISPVSLVVPLKGDE
jgi:hypothetical protein